MALALSIGGYHPVDISCTSEGNEEARTAFQAAQNYRQQGDARSARIELLNAIKADPQWIDARIAQAEVLLKLNDGIGAQAELDKAIQLGSELSRTRHLYGHALQLQGKLREAKNELMADDIPLEYQATAARIMGRVAQQLGDDMLGFPGF